MNSVTAFHHSDVGHSEHAFWALKLGFIAAPLIAGLDKFANYLTDWPKYLAPVFPNMLGVTPQTFMQGVGVIEIVAAIGVLLKPRIFSYVVSAWLVGIIVNLLILGAYFDIALRDLGLAIGAYALGQLAPVHEHQVSTDVVTERKIAA
ncbi:MAG: hypothetical protein ACJ76H_00765 [Bacteriovoracaceae bacterium]